jgi:hypothetical protein
MLAAGMIEQLSRYITTEGDSTIRDSGENDCACRRDSIVAMQEC